MSEVKRKRGRPSILWSDEWAFLENMWGDLVTTRRGLLNKHYEIEGFRVIRKMQEQGIIGLEFISDPAKQKSRWGILRELGRFDEDTIRAYAPELCEAQKNSETKRTVREWESFLRLIRLRPDLIKVAISETVSENEAS